MLNIDSFLRFLSAHNNRNFFQYPNISTTCFLCMTDSAKVCVKKQAVVLLMIFLQRRIPGALPKRLAQISII